MSKDLIEFKQQMQYFFIVISWASFLKGGEKEKKIDEIQKLN